MVCVRECVCASETDPGVTPVFEGVCERKSVCVSETDASATTV